MRHYIPALLLVAGFAGLAWVLIDFEETRHQHCIELAKVGIVLNSCR